MYKKDYYENNKDKIKEYNRKYLEKNPDKMNEYRKKYWQDHKEEMYVKQKAWRDKNKDKLVNYVSNSRKKRVERLRAEGCTNAWSVVGRGAKPRYKKEV